MKFTRNRNMELGHESLDELYDNQVRNTIGIAMCLRLIGQELIEGIRPLAGVSISMGPVGTFWFRRELREVLGIRTKISEFSWGFRIEVFIGEDKDFKSEDVDRSITKHPFLVTDFHKETQEFSCYWTTPCVYQEFHNCSWEMIQKNLLWQKDNLIQWTEIGEVTFSHDEETGQPWHPRVCVNTQSLESSPLPEKKAFIKSFVRAIKVTGNGGHITYTFPIPPDNLDEEKLGVLPTVRYGGR